MSNLLLLTQCNGALGPQTSALVLWEIKPQRVVSYGLRDVTKIVHQVPTQRTVQEGVPQWGRGTVKIPRHGEQALTHAHCDKRAKLGCVY